MKNKLFYLPILMVFLFSTSSFFANGISSVKLGNPPLSLSEWNQLFPNRAGLNSGHPQGYTSDFFSYANFVQAVNEMSVFLVQIKRKPGVNGEVVTVTNRNTQNTYAYTTPDSSWYNNPTPEVVVNVDFANFINITNSLNNKRELGAFLANISKETTGGWQTPVGGGSSGDYAKWGLYFVHELGYNATNSAGAYSQTSAEYPPNPNKGYYGRGPIQLSWNYNYGQFSKFLYNDKNVLLNNPDLVQQDGVLAFKSAIWFWMMPQWPKPSCHQVMHDLWVPSNGEYAQAKMYLKGFAHTNNIINGGLECRTSSSASFTEKVVLRSELYKYYLGVLGLTSIQISAEDSGQYTTTCYQSSSSAMESYVSGNVLASEGFNVQKFSFAPNPVADYLNFSYEKPIIKVEVYNIFGQLLAMKDMFGKEGFIDFTNYQSGVYCIKVYSQSGQASFPVIKN